MRFKTLFAAVGLAVAAMGASGAAHAHDRWDDRRWEDRRWDGDRRWDNDRRWTGDRRWHNSRHWKKHDRRYYRPSNRCWNEWHYGQRYRVCR